jgi:hypothetical protein
MNLSTVVIIIIIIVMFSSLLTTWIKANNCSGGKEITVFYTTRMFIIIIKMPANRIHVEVIYMLLSRTLNLTLTKNDEREKEWRMILFSQYFSLLKVEAAFIFAFRYSNSS